MRAWLVCFVGLLAEQRSRWLGLQSRDLLGSTYCWVEPQVGSSCRSVRIVADAGVEKSTQAERANMPRQCQTLPPLWPHES